MNSLLRLLPIVLLAIICFPLNSEAQKSQWVDSVLTQMTIEEKVGQIFMIRAFSKNDPEHVQDVKRQIEKYHVGGVCFFQGSPLKQAQLVNEYQAMSNIPLLIGLDGEWGLGMRFPKQAISFPRNLTVGAVNDHQLIYRMGKEIGRQGGLIGVNLNFAPVADVNNNAANPVINFRSFGEDRFNVASKAYAFMKGLEDENVMACAKHFPGHGDTDTDSHYDLPVIPHSRRRLDSIELFPFRMMIQQGIPSLMVAHLQVPTLDGRPNRPTTVSSKVVTDLLRNDLDFQRLIITDAMEMKGVTKHFEPGEADLEAFLAGNDIVLLPEDIDKAYSRILSAVESGEITEARLDASILRILSEKFELDLHKKVKFTNINNLQRELNSTEAKVIRRELYEKALTLVRNEGNILPISDLLHFNYGSISLGVSNQTSFQKRLLSYVDSDNYYLPKDSESKEYELKLSQLSRKDIVFVSIHDMSWHARKDYGIQNDQIRFIEALSKRTKVVLTLFGSPYALKYFEENPQCIIVANEDHEDAQEAAAQAIMGALDMTGRLPVTVGKSFKAGQGIYVPSLRRIGFSIPEAVGLNSDTLNKIRYIVDELIEKKAAPGCQVLVAKDNKVVYWKAFGHHTYEKKNPVTKQNLYDLASVTKILASTVSVMKLMDDGKMALSNSVGQHVPEEDTTNKSDLNYEDMLAHVSGLAGWIPFYANTLEGEKKKEPSSRYYRNEPTDSFNVVVTPNLYLRLDYPDTIWRRIFSSQLRENTNYRYSDLAFYIVNRTIKNITGFEVDGFAEANFYRPIGLRSTLFNPLRAFDSDQIPPSEDDEYFRMSRVQGTVHDMGAAMLNGISGHAGLFSNALEVGIMMQMLLNKGYYGGTQYLDPRTVRYFTQRHWRSTRRGIGFDMKELNPDKNPNMSEKASRHAFGHTGFTGTATYADPDYDIVFVFLSNRTFPTMRNNKLGRENYRPKIQTVIYDALIN